MTEKKTKIMVNDEVYTEFRDHIKRTKGKVRGEMAPALEEALELYIKIHSSPDLQRRVYEILPEGHGSHPRIQKFLNEFEERFEGYPLVGSGELNNWIKSTVEAYSETALKKWRNRLRDTGRIEYLNNNRWSLPGNDPGDQATLTPSPHKNLYNLLEPGRKIGLKKLQDLSGRDGPGLKKLILNLEKEGKLEPSGVGYWRVLEPESMDTL